MTTNEYMFELSFPEKAQEFDELVAKVIDQEFELCELRAQLTWHNINEIPTEDGRYLVNWKTRNNTNIFQVWSWSNEFKWNEPIFRYNGTFRWLYIPPIKE